MVRNGTKIVNNKLAQRYFERNIFRVHLFFINSQTFSYTFYTIIT